MKPSPSPGFELAIGELRLTGFDPHGRTELADHIQTALAALLAADADAWCGGADLAIDRLDLGRLAPGTTRAATADRIAQSIHSAIVTRRNASSHQT